MDAHNQKNAAKAKKAFDGTAMSPAKDEINNCFKRIPNKDIVLCILLLLLVGWLFFYEFNKPEVVPIVRLTIDSYDGLPRNESNLVFSPEFNLTMYGEKGPKLNGVNKMLCYSQGSIKIWSQGLSFASGYITGSCLNATNGHTIPLFAWGKHVEMPLYLENRLRDEVKNGTAVLNTDVILLIACDTDSTYCGRCSFLCQLLIGDKEFSKCLLTDVQEFSNSLE